MRPNPYPMSPQFLKRLRCMARSVGALVWQDGAGRVYQQFNGCPSHQVDTTTLRRAGWVRCLQPAAPCCGIEANHRVLGQRVACTRCGALSATLPADVLDQFTAGSKKPAEAG